MNKKQERQLNTFEKELLTRRGEVIIPVGFGKYEKTIVENIHEWYKNQENINFLFKEQEKHGEDVDGEILFGIFANEIGLPVVNVYPAVKVDKFGIEKKGIAIQSFVEEKNQKAITALEILKRSNLEHSNDIQSHLIAVSNFAKSFEAEGKELVVDSRLEEKLFTMCLLDYFSHCVDRHAENISYIIEKTSKNKYTLTLAKAYDNEYAFIMETRNFKSSVSEEDMKRGLCFFVYGNDKDSFYQIPSAIKSNKMYMQIYKKITNFNFDKIKQKLKEKHPNYKISKQKLDWAKHIFEMAKSVLDKEIEKQSSKLNKNKENERVL